VGIESAFQTLGVALGLGLLVGLQRERVEKRLGGVRTYALLTVFGALCGLLAEPVGLWFPAAGLLGVVGLILVGDYMVVHSEAKPGAGVTTELAMLFMYVVGVSLAVGPMSIGVALGGGAAVLLYAKPELHSLVQRMGDRDVRAIMQFALITLVILPVLPSRTYGPYDVLNPFNIWLMVVLVSGISLGGYVAYKLVGSRAGVAAAGLLGGAISSTATTASYARSVRGEPARLRIATLAIILAGAVSMVRVLVEVSVVAPEFLRQVGLPVGALMGLTLLIGAGAWFSVRGGEQGMPEQRNPAELKSALLFGALYAIIILAVAAAKQRFEDRGLYAVAIISGLTDMDAITLSISRLVGEERLDPAQGWRVIVLAILSNMVFKSALAGALGGWRLFLIVAGLFSVVGVLGVSLLIFL